MHRLRQLRLEKAMSQRDLAEAAGVALMTVFRLERAAEQGGGSPPLPSTVRKLATALGVRPERLTRCGPTPRTAAE